MFFANGGFGPAARPIKFGDDLRARGLFHSQRVNPIFVRIELQVFTGGERTGGVDGVQNEVGSELIEEVRRSARMHPPGIRRNYQKLNVFRYLTRHGALD